MAKRDIHYGEVACIQLYWVRGDIHYSVDACVQYTVVRGNIHYGVVACIQLYSGEGRHTLWCSSMCTIIQW